MKAYHYLGIGIKLFAIGLFLFSIKNMAFLLENIIYGTVQGILASATASGLIYLPWLFLAILLWNFPLSIAKKIIPPGSEIEPTGMSPNALLSVFISAISLFFLYNSILDTVYWLTVLNLGEGGMYATLAPENKANIFATGVELFSAGILFFNSKKISLWASRF